MSHLSERCQQFLTENGTSVYQLSKTSGLDRASLHRLVTGKRIPTLEFLTKFCSAMRLNQADIRELMALYEEAHAGPIVYRNRQLIHQILFNLSDLTKDSGDPSAPISGDPAADIFPLPAQAHTSLQTRALIEQFLDNVFKNPATDGEILTNVPLGRMELLPVVYNLHKRYPKEVRLRHLFYFSSNPSLADESNPNLEIIKWILPMALTNFDSYEPCYTYLKASKNDMEMLLWPYYLISGDTAVVVSASLQAAIVHRDPGTVAMYRQEMEALLSHSKPLLISTHTLQDSLDFYNGFFSKENPLTGVVEYQPCLSPFVPLEYYEQFVQKVTAAEAPDSSSAFSLFLRGPHFPQKSATFYFSREGLQSFCETGKLLGQYGTYLPSLSIPDRRRCLEQFCSSYRDTGCVRLLRGNLQIPVNLNIELYRHSTILFMVFEEDYRIRFVSISESSLYESFLDFFHSLEEPYYSYSPEETLEEVRQALHSL
ncbi:MAG: helix-turn-helix transcriptional regulator [Eubacteriales bacterium]|nr:helix-turn-helix transcriptional regulator [Eubacteriales bacterium]